MPQAGPFLAKAFFAFVATQIVSGGKAFKKPKSPSLANQGDPGIKVNTRSTQEYYSVVYGQHLVGGNEVFIEEAGVDNKELWIVLNLAESECDSIAQVDGVGQIFLNGKLYTEFGGNVQYWFHAGSSTQTYDTNLNAAIPKWNDNKRHVCYLVVKLTMDQNYFQAVPVITVLLKGRKLYDFRTSTTAWSDNPVLAAYDYLTHNRYGLKKAASLVDIDSWTAAANYCDTKGWKINHVLKRPDGGRDILDDMLHLFRGQLTSYDDKLYLRYADLNYETSVKTIKDEHIVRGSDNKAQISIDQSSKFGKADALRAKFYDPDKNWTLDDLVIGDQLGVIKDFSMIGSTDRQHVSDITVYNLERMQLDRIISGTFRDDCLELEPHDVVTLNTTALSMSDQLARVQQADVRPDYLIDLALLYENIALYNPAYDIVPENIYTCNLPDHDQEPPSVGNVALTEEVYDKRLRSDVTLHVTFDKPVNYPWFDRVEVWLSYGDVIYEHLFDAENNFKIEPLKEGQTVYLKLKTVSIWGQKTKDPNDYKVSRLVLGASQTVPPSIPDLQAIVNENGTSVYSTWQNAPDTHLYEFRLGSSWTGGIFLALEAAPNLFLKGVKPGSHPFWASTKSTNGRYGSTPRSASAEMIDPPDGWSVQAAEVEDYIDDVANGDFATDTVWNKGVGWTISGGTANCDGTQTGNSDLDQNKNFIAGRQYEITYTVSGYLGGNVTLFVGNTGAGTARNANGTYTEKVTCAGTPATKLILRADVNFVGSIDNVSVRSGSHSNTERYLYNSDYYLKCSHAGGNLGGTFNGPIIDLGVSARHQIYLLGDIVVIGEGTTCDDIFPTTDHPIEAMTSANPCVVTWTGHGLTTGKYVSFEGITQTDWDSLNNQHKSITVINADSFSLDGVDTTAFAAYNAVTDPGLIHKGLTGIDLDIANKTVTELTELPAAPSVRMKIKYGDTTPPTNVVDKQEILTAIVTGRYFQQVIEITDPTPGVYALVEPTALKFCTKV